MVTMLVNHVTVNCIDEGQDDTDRAPMYSDCQICSCSCALQIPDSVALGLRCNVDLSHGQKRVLDMNYEFLKWDTKG